MQGLRMMKYKSLEENHYYIDKTETLEKGITAFPSIYIEGAAASGKTTAVKMLLARHPEVEPIVFNMEEEQDSEHFQAVLMELTVSLKEEMDAEPKPVWIIFENIRNQMSRETAGAVVDFIRNCPRHCRMILVGRERPHEELLDLLWKREMELLPQNVLLFTRQEIREYAEQTESSLDTEQIYRETGGWAGCVDMMIRLAKIHPGISMCSDQNSIPVPENIRRSYEIDSYIRQSILSTLSSEEQEIMKWAAICPWLNLELCEEICGFSDAENMLDLLNRKGMLLYDIRKKCWKAAPLFKKCYQSKWKEEQKQRPSSDIWNRMGKWYEAHGYIKEALWCLKRSENDMEYCRCVTVHYDEVPFLEISYDEVMEWEENSPEICYLRGMYCYFHRNPEGLDREIRKIEKKLEDRNHRAKEIYLNLTYVKPDLSLNDWLALLEKYASDPIRLYQIPGSSFSCLCGLRDLSGLFACTKKEENRKAGIWKECLGPEEWKYYQLARMDYYLETERKDAISEEDWMLLEKRDESQPWQFQMAVLHLLCKLQAIQAEAEYEESIHWLISLLEQEDSIVCIRNAEAIGCIHAADRGEPEKMVRWLRYNPVMSETEITEDNYAVLYNKVRGYMNLNQYAFADKILRRLIPYLQFYHRTRFLAELLFQQAVIHWEEGRQSQALKNVIESFLVNGNCRYVWFYTEYGKKGKNVLEAYVEWMQNNTPGGWHRKKKYNYGNVLRMPLEDYMEVILRRARREARSGGTRQKKTTGEHLTMMETIILQDISHGLSNTEISRELNLKLTTVKSHIYSLYKKLGVNNRVQAILKGKEMGVLK